MARILVADDDPDVRQLVETTLRNRGHDVVVAESGTGALQLAERIGPEMVILDVNMPGMEGTRVARSLRTRPATATIPILLLTALSGEADTLAGFAAGVDDCVAKPFNPRELGARVTALLARAGSASAPAARPQGSLVAVAGPKGGAGKTTVAVNLALAAHRGAVPRRTVLVEGALQLGDIAVHLDLLGAQSLLDLVPYAGRLDVAAVENVLARHSSGLEVLLRPGAAEQVERITGPLVRETVEILASIADLVVVDLPSAYDDERALAVLELAETILLVVTPDIGALWNASDFLRLAPRLGIEAGRIRVVLNRAEPRRGLSPSDVAAALGVSRVEPLPEAGSTISEQVNLGVPVLDAEPRGELARRLRQLGASLVSRGAIGLVR